VRYSFVGRVPPSASAQFVEGTTDNISGGGLKLVGKLPNTDWIASLLLQHIAVAVEVHLPDGEEPVRALARTAWVELHDKKKLDFLMGLRFREISRDDRERVIQFVIKSQLK
jgi:c-di-GMP-binding flagellar brake protein YcgR